MRTFNIKTPDKKIVPALQDKIDNLTKPKGSLCLQPTMVWLSKESAFLPRK